jgi:hypothetical protein
MCVGVLREREKESWKGEILYLKVGSFFIDHIKTNNPKSSVACVGAQWCEWVAAAAARRLVVGGCCC